MRTFKEPLGSILIEAARMYALDSHQHTMNYAGWEDEDNTPQKIQRILHGRLAQLWLGEWCRINQVPHVADRSLYTHADGGVDLTILNHPIDVKASFNLPPQVGSHLREKAGGAEWFAFASLPWDLSWICIDGLIATSDFFQRAQFIPYGQNIPGTQLRQRFQDGSYFLLDRSPLHSLSEIVETWTVEQKREKMAHV